jgi:hypothetical protein
VAGKQTPPATRHLLLRVRSGDVRSQVWCTCTCSGPRC